MITPLLDPISSNDEKFYKIYTNNTANNYSIYLNSALEEPANYHHLLDFLRNRSTYDTINMYLNLPGGRLDIGAQILGAMDDCKCHIRTILDGSVSSFGCYIFLAGDEYKINENSRGLMFHNYTSGLIGKGNEIESNTESTKLWVRNLSDKYCVPLLSEQEIKDIVNGGDLYLSPKELKKRFERIIKQQKKKKK